MERETVYVPQQASNYDEFFMQQTLLFADNLKDLKYLRKQLYSAAEYFELSYHKDDHKQFMVETLKDYLTKALVSTVDHLGSVAYKVNSFVDEKVNEVSETKLRFSCIEQRLRACQQFVDQGGLSQQSFFIKTPKYHKRYTVPAGEAMPTISNTKSMHNSSKLCPEYDLNPTKKAVQATTMKVESPFRKGLSSTESPSNPGTFSFTRVLSTKETGKRAASPLRFSLKRSGSLVNRSNSPSRNDKQWFPSEPQRSVSMCIHPESNRKKEIQSNSKRSKNFFKALYSAYTCQEKKMYHTGIGMATDRVNTT